jgi:hypothetical protein
MWLTLIYKSLLSTGEVNIEVDVWALGTTRNVENRNSKFGYFTGYLKEKLEWLERLLRIGP